METEKIIEGEITYSKTGIFIEGKTDKDKAIHFSLLNIPELSAFGVSNITEDHKYILFIDYDNTSKRDLDGELTMLNREFFINEFLILTTGENHYQVVAFDKFDLDQIVYMLGKTNCDYSYKSAPIKLDKGWILRIDEKADIDGNIIQSKPKYVSFIVFKKRPGYTPEKSRAHIQFFSSLYPEFGDELFIQEDLFDNMDRYEKVKLIKYKTSKKDFLVGIGMDKLEWSKRLIIEFDEGGE